MQDKINALIEELRQGKQEYFNSFYDLTKNAVFYTIKKIVGNCDIASDVMQDTYIAFFNSINSIDKSKNAYSYLLTIARNKSINEYKKVVRVEYVDFLETIPYEAGELDAPLLDYCKQNLSLEEFSMLEWFIIYGYKQVEIAKLLNKPVSTVNWQYQQLLKKINKYYKEVYNEKIQ